MIDSKLNEAVTILLRTVSEKIILPHYQNLKKRDIQEKTPGDYVTVADHLSEEMFSAELTKILPEAAVVGEEAAAADPDVVDRLQQRQAWIIDPIDGTGNFAAGKPPFGILIALTEGGETVAGWLYDPLTQRICHAVRSGGAYINGQKIMVSTESIDRPVAALATGFMTSEQREAVLAAANPHYNIVDIPRCAAEQYPRLVQGANHVSIFERTLPWDHAAGVLFLNEAGGKAARWDGSPYIPSDKKTGMLGASSPEIWDKAAEHFSHIFAK